MAKNGQTRRWVCPFFAMRAVYQSCSPNFRKISVMHQRPASPTRVKIMRDKTDISPNRALTKSNLKIPIVPQFNAPITTSARAILSKTVIIVNQVPSVFFANIVTGKDPDYSVKNQFFIFQRNLLRQERKEGGIPRCGIPEPRASSRTERGLLCRIFRPFCRRLLP